MPSLTTGHPLALRILMDSDIYAIPEKIQEPTSILAPQAQVKAARESIKVVPAIEKVEAKPEKASFNYLGENNKYLLVLVNDPAYEFCAPKTLEALTNMLKAKQLEIKDIALVNLAKQKEASFKLLKEYFACSKIVLFGINPAQIGLKEITSNQIISFDGVKILATYSFAEMDEDVARKRAFWTEMKVL